MNMSTQINELATALSKAQGKIQPAIKDKKNPHFKSSYADLGSIWEACRSALSDNGLAVVQTIEAHHESTPTLITILTHSSGQWIRSEMPIITQKMDPQGIGSALTYYRRYCLASMVGVAPEDDDAEGAQKREYRQPVAEVKPQPQTITKEQASELYEKLLWCPLDYQKTIADYCQKSNVAQDFQGLPSHLFARLSQSISQKLSESKSALHAEAQAVQA